MTHATAATFAGAPGPRRKNSLGDVGLRDDAGVAIRDGRILAVASTKVIRRRYEASKTIDAGGMLVTPGFVDPHTHLPFAGNRAFELAYKLAGKSYETILRAGGGIHRTVADTRLASQKELTRLVRNRTQTMLDWGTTTAEAKSGYGLGWAQEAKQLRAIRAANDPHGVELVPTFLGAHVIPPEHKSDREAWIQQLTETMIPAVARQRLAEFCDVFLERSAYSREETVAILLAARQNGLRLKLHADEFTNQEGAELAAFLRATSCEHLLEVSKTGIARLAKSDAVAVLLPGVAALGFLDHQAPARDMVKGGVAVALGSDFNPNCPVLTMPTILQWGVYALRLTPEEALTAATTNAAHAIARGDRIGRLQPGYQADLLVHRVPSVEELAYWVGPNPVQTVVKRGRIVRSP